VKRSKNPNKILRALQSIEGISWFVGPAFVIWSGFYLISKDHESPIWLKALILVPFLIVGFGFGALLVAAIKKKK
jgi:hypothetical protein